MNKFVHAFQVSPNLLLNFCPFAFLPSFAVGKGHCSKLVIFRRLNNATKERVKRINGITAKIENSGMIGVGIGLSVVIVVGV
jgi:hypothetical protein